MTTYTHKQNNGSSPFIYYKYRNRTGYTLRVQYVGLLNLHLIYFDISWYFVIDKSHLNLASEIG